MLHVQVQICATPFPTQPAAQQNDPFAVSWPESAAFSGVGCLSQLAKYPWHFARVLH